MSTGSVGASDGICHDYRMRIESLGSLTEAALATAADGAAYGRGPGLVDAVGELRIADGARAAAPARLHNTTRLRKQLERNIDDSSGVAVDVCQRAVRLYARACCASPPAPGKLGR